MASSDATFDSWLETQAPNTNWLKPTLEHVHSPIKIVALIAYGILFIAYSAYIILGPRHSRKDHRSTDQITREVWQSLEAEPYLPESSKPESSKTDLALAERTITPDQSHASGTSSKEQDSVGEVFLVQMKNEMEARNTTFADEFRRLTRQDGVLFSATIVAATITILIIVAGTVLLFAGRVTLGIIDGVVGLIPGSGTVLLRKRSTDTRTNMNNITQMREDNLRVLQAIQATLLIPDIGKRSEAIGSLAEQLRKRAFKSS